jgi:hypothetical protein
MFFNETCQQKYLKLVIFERKININGTIFNLCTQRYL